MLVPAALVQIAFGLAFLFVPVWSMGLFSIHLALEGAMMTQLFSATLLGFGVLNIAARNMTRMTTLRPILLANLVMNFLGFVITAYYNLVGLGNMVAWIISALYLVFAITYGYLMTCCGVWQHVWGKYSEQGKRAV